MENPSPFFLDSLYCEEERFIEEDDEEQHHQLGQGNPINYNDSIIVPSSSSSSSTSCSALFSHDFFCEDDEELLSLFSKEEEEEQTRFEYSTSHYSKFISLARTEAVEWMLKVNAHYGFTTLTAILSINYLDRFLCNFHLQEDKPWMIQLLAVTCLSLAAKVEETQIPLLLDFQVEETKYLFEAKTIQRMELLVLSTLKWKMHPVTPLSFIDHIVRRLGLKSNFHWEFLKRCERLLLSVVSDAGFVGYLPSVLATATMMHVFDHFEPLDSIDHQNQLMGVLKVNKEKVNACYERIHGLLSGGATEANRKRKRDDDDDDDGDGDDGDDRNNYEDELIPESPNGVIDAAGLSSSSSSDDDGDYDDDEDDDDDDEKSNGCWEVGPPSDFSSPPLKKSRTQDQQQQHLPIATATPLGSIAAIWTL